MAATRTSPVGIPPHSSVPAVLARSTSPAEQQAEQPGAQPRPGRVEFVVLLEGQARQSDDGCHDLTRRLVERGATAHREHAAQPAAAPERVQGEGVVAAARGGAGAGAAGEQDGSRPDARRAAQRARWHPPGTPCRSAPAASKRATPLPEAAGELGEGSAQAVGAECGEGDGALGIERPGVPGVGVLGDEVGGRTGHGDEGSAVRHLEERQAVAAAGVDEGRRRSVAHHLGAEAEADDAATDEPLDVGVGISRIGGLRHGSVAELRSRGQQHLVVDEEGGRVGQVGAVGPLHTAVEGAERQGVGVAQECERQLGPPQQGGEGGKHGVAFDGDVHGEHPDAIQCTSVAIGCRMQRA